MKVYGIVYASMFDEHNVFLYEEDAKLFKRMLAKRHKLRSDDPMLRIISFEIHEKYDPSLYAPKKITLKKKKDKK